MNFQLDNLETLSLNKADLSDAVRERLGLNKREAKEIVEGFFDALSNELSAGRNVKLAGFGNFNVQKKTARPGRNLHTGETVEVQAHVAIRFQAGPSLKRQMSPKTPAAPEGEAEPTSKNT